MPILVTPRGRTARAGAILCAVAAATAFILACKSNTTSPTESPNANDVQLAPPPAGQGFQIAIGPFDVPAGQEVQRNYYLKIPESTDVYVNRIQFLFNQGSHHCNIFKSDSADVADHFEATFDAIPFQTWDMVAASQKDTLTWTIPAGTAIHLRARQQLLIQTHYVNATTQQTATGRGLCLINFWTTPAANVATTVGAIFSNNRTLKIPPHTGQTYRKVVYGFSGPVDILLMTGHFHSRGKTFLVGHWNGTMLTDTIYQNTAWDEPPIDQYAPPIHLDAGDSLAFVTSYENRTDNEIDFGSHVETQEHANLFTFYTPGLPSGKAVYDFTGGQLLESHPLP